MNSPVKMIVDTPGKLFYEEQVKYLLDKDVESLVEKHYHDNAVIVSFDHIVRGKEQDQRLFQPISQFGDNRAGHVDR